jgi:ribosome modulation factor
MSETKGPRCPFRGKSHETVWFRGYCAGQRGTKRVSCPYVRGPGGFAKAWLRGWDAAQASGIAVWARER